MWITTIFVCTFLFSFLFATFLIYIIYFSQSEHFYKHNVQTQWYNGTASSCETEVGVRTWNSRFESVWFMYSRFLKEYEPDCRKYPCHFVVLCSVSPYWITGRFFKTATLIEMTYNETNFTVGMLNSILSNIRVSEHFPIMTQCIAMPQNGLWHILWYNKINDVCWRSSSTQKQLPIHFPWP